MKIKVDSTLAGFSYSVQSHGCSINVTSNDLEEFRITDMQRMHAGIHDMNGLLSITPDLAIRIDEGKLSGLSNPRGTLFIPFREKAARRFLETLIRYEATVRAC